MFVLSNANKLAANSSFILTQCGIKCKVFLSNLAPLDITTASRQTLVMNKTNPGAKLKTTEGKRVPVRNNVQV